MPQFALTMSARSGGETIHKSYNFELNYTLSEQEIVQSYQEFYPLHSNIRVVSFLRVEKGREVEAA